MREGGAGGTCLSWAEILFVLDALPILVESRLQAWRMKQRVLYEKKMAQSAGQRAVYLGFVNLQ